ERGGCRGEVRDPRAHEGEHLAANFELVVQRTDRGYRAVVDVGHVPREPVELGVVGFVAALEETGRKLGHDATFNDVHVATAWNPGAVAPPHIQSRPWYTAKPVPCRGTSIGSVDHASPRRSCTIGTRLPSNAGSPPATTTTPPKSAAAAPDVACA